METLLEDPHSEGLPVAPREMVVGS